MAEKKLKMPEPKDPPVLTKISVEGFKCFRDKTDVEIRPLTILAGANSSGKTSIMQPLLLMKQTMLFTTEISSALLIDGPNVSFAYYDQIFGKHGDELLDKIKFILTRSDNNSLELILKRSEDDLIWEELVPKPKDFKTSVNKFLKNDNNDNILPNANNFREIIQFYFTGIKTLIHVPGVRMAEPRHNKYLGIVNPKSFYSGHFDLYVAGIVDSWQRMNRIKSIGKLKEQLRKLDLANGIYTRRSGSESLLLFADMREKRKESGHSFNIADVGVGVSQVLPVLVALITAESGQIVYIEQPEIHLHPRAQFDLAAILADAAKRGVIVIAETHSDNLLLGIQHQVASGQLDANKAMLHWFERDEDGASHVTSTELDEHGTYGDWPEDFSSVTMKNQKEFLDASLKWD